MKFLGKTKVFAIIFYVIAALYCLYTIFSIVSTIQYLSEVASSGMYVSITFPDMLQAFVGQVGPNLVYTLVLFFCGYAIDLISGNIVPAGKVETVSAVTASAPVVSDTNSDEDETDFNKTVDLEHSDLDKTADLNHSDLEETVADMIDSVDNNNLIEEVELKNEEDK